MSAKKIKNKEVKMTKFSKVLCYLLVFIISTGFVSARDVAPMESEETGWADWTRNYDDPIELAKKVMKKSYTFWSFTGHTITKGTYMVGRFFATHGVGYILLESPSLAFDLAIGGHYKALHTIGWDLLTEIVTSSIKTPGKISKKIAKETIKLGLDEYDKAYKIARNYIRTKYLSREDALKFLNYRWGVFKLSAARQLMNSQEKEISITNQEAGILANYFLDKTKEKYLQKLVVNPKLLILEVCKIIETFFDMLKKERVGLSQYQPYLKFKDQMDYINKLRLKEMDRFKKKNSGIIKKKVTLRSVSKTLSRADIGSMCKQKGFYDAYYKGLKWSKGFNNSFEKKYISGDQVVIDHSNDLMWHQSGSDECTYKAAKQWINNLNRQGYAGYSDWRLPTLEEACSLSEPKENDNGLYIDPVFSKEQCRIWTNDLNYHSRYKMVWVLSFLEPHWVAFIDNTAAPMVRPVRSLK